MFDIAMSGLFVDNTWIQHEAHGEENAKIWYQGILWKTGLEGRLLLRQRKRLKNGMDRSRQDITSPTSGYHWM
jgi:hypothetical protein